MPANATTPPEARTAPFASWGSYLSAAAIVLLGTLALTLWTWYAARGAEEELAELRFTQRIDMILNRTRERLQDCTLALWAARGLFDSQRDVTRAEWRTFSQALLQSEKLAGVQGLGFTLRVPADELPAHLAAIRAEGFPDYTVHPDHPRPEYHSIIFLEPFRDRNLRAFGYDMMTEPGRQQAMEMARDTGNAAITNRVVLVQEIPGQRTQAGFLIYLPVYHRDSPRETVADRRANLLGFVYSPVRAGDFFDRLLFLENLGVGMQVYSEGTPGPDTLVYDTDEQPDTESHPTGDAPRFTGIRHVPLLGRDWVFRFRSLPSFEAANQSHYGWILVFGGALSLLASGIVIAQSSRTRALAREASLTKELRLARNNLEQQVERRTAELEQAKASVERELLEKTRMEEALERTAAVTRQFTDALDRVPFYIYLKDTQRRHTYGNRMVLELFRCSATELIGQGNEKFFPPATAAQLQEIEERVLAGETSQDELHVATDTGERIFWDVKYPMRDAEGRITGICGIASDITEQRRLLHRSEEDARAKTELLREVNHRVSNNLTSILGLIVGEIRVLDPSAVTTAKPILDRLSQRIHSLLSVHLYLADTKWAPVRIEKLVRQVVQSALAADSDRRPVSLDLPTTETLVSPRQASSLALVLNELTTNAVKYGHVSTHPLCLTVAVATEPGFIQITFADNGTGLPPDVLAGRRQGVGLALARQLVTDTLRGSFRLGNTPGATVTLRFRTEEPGRT